MKKIAAIFLLLMTGLDPVFSQDRIRLDFYNPSEATATNFESSEINDGMFVGKTKWDPALSLSLPKAGLDASALSFLTLRMYSSDADPCVEIVYESPNKDWCLGASFAVVAGWAVYTIDLNKVDWKHEGSGPEAKVWGGREKKVSALRFDPGNADKRIVKIDWIEIGGPEGKVHKVEKEESKAKASALASLNWKFDAEGELLGWQPANFDEVGVKDGAMRGVTQRFSQLFSPEIAVDTGKYQTFTFVAKSDRPGSGAITFKSSGETLVRGPYVPEHHAVPFDLIGDGEVHAYDVNLSQCHFWKGNITGLRFDLTYTPGTKFELASCRFMPNTENRGLISNSGFEVIASDKQVLPEIWKVAAQGGGRAILSQVDKLGHLIVFYGAQGGAVVTLSNRVEFDFPGRYNLKLDFKPELVRSGDKLSVQLRFKDILNQQLKELLDYNIDLENAKDWKTFSNSFMIPEKAATGEVELLWTSSSATSAVAVDNIILDLEQKDEGNLMANPDQSFDWKAHWIWKPDLDMTDQAPLYLRKKFVVPDASEVERGEVIVTVDNRYTLYVNGKKLAHGPFHDTWQKSDIYDIKEFLRSGENVVGVEAVNDGGPAGMLLEAGVRLRDGQVVYIVSNETWKWSKEGPGDWSSATVSDDKWGQAKSYVIPPGLPWGSPAPYIYFGPTHRVRVKSVSFPAAITRGKDLNVILELGASGKGFGGAVLFAELIKAGDASGISVLRKEIPGIEAGKEVPLQVSIPLSKYGFIDEGSYDIKLGMTKASLVLEGPGDGIVEKGNFLVKRVELKDDGQPIKIPKVRYESANGSPAIYVNGTPQPVMNCLPVKITNNSSGVGSRRQIELSRDNNIHMYFVEAGAIKIMGERIYDFTELDQMVKSVLALDPDAHIVVSAVLDGTNNAGLKEWNEKYPDEVVKLADGSTNLAAYGGGNSKTMSMASEVWMGLAEDLFRKLIRHVRGRKYGERVIGFLPCSGSTWEWMYWGGSTLDPNKFPDYSKPYQQAFQKWALAKYGNLSALNQVWRKNFATPEQVCVPTKDERVMTDTLSFLTPKNSQYVIDYHQFHSELVANDILRLAKAAKEETKGESLFGTYYGYTTYAMYFPTNKTMGHLALKKVLDSPDVDFLMSPSRYEDRAIGGSSGFMTVTDSLSLHKKLWVDQADLRTVHAGVEQAPETRVDTLLDSRAVIARHFANSLVNGCSQQWFDFSTGWITGDARLMQWVGKLQQIERDMAKVSRITAHRDSSIAVIVDEESTYYTNFHANVHLEMVHNQYRGLANTGVGFDTYLLGDLEKIPPYKCYLFLNTFRMTDAQLAFIDQHLKKDKRVLVFAYAAGSIGKEDLSANGVVKLTGINIKMFNDARAVLVKLGKTAHPIGKYIGESTYGFNNEYGPWFAPTEGEVLGTINGMEQPGLVVKNNPEWTCVYSAAAPLPVGLVRGIAEFSGIPVVNPSDMAGEVTYVGDRLVAIHTLCGGKRSLAFPKNDGAVRELIYDQEYALKDGHIDVNLASRSTYLFHY